ncbi:MAG TPA: DNA-directed RNA polymerase subunit alpha C-terminal domain-containing protein [Arachidicoccus sp.]|nr:DNA-directed RNA polymerase subunit alpha C-terminal domain-containing protein [Arachidicoccus sp.]
MIDPKLILRKLKISRLESIDNILEDERLCMRIMKEKPIKVADFLRKKLISAPELKKLINGRIISQFSNSENKGSPKYIFENEIEPFLIESLAYHNSALKTIRAASEFILKVFDPALTEPELEILKIHLLEYGNAESFVKFLMKYNLTRHEAIWLFNRSLAKIRLRKNLYDVYIKDWSEEKYKLIDEVKILRNLKDSLYDRVRTVKVKNNLDVFVEDLDILGKNIEDLNLSVRAYNALKSFRIDTIQDLLEYCADDLIRRRNVGSMTIKEVKEKLAEYDLRLTDDN